jgi:hypothetical protein
MTQFQNFPTDVGRRQESGDPHAALAAFEKRLEQGYPESWRPQHEDAGHPDRLIGTLVGVTELPTKYQPDGVPVLTIEDADGKRWSVWVTSPSLEDKIARAEPQPGERIAITHVGLVPSKSDPTRRYRAWDFDVDREPPERVDWSAARRRSGTAYGAPPKPESDIPVDSAGLAEVVRDDDDCPF